MMNVVGGYTGAVGGCWGQEDGVKTCVDMIVISKVRQDTWVLKRLFHVYHVFPGRLKLLEIQSLVLVSCYS